MQHLLDTLHARYFCIAFCAKCFARRSSANNATGVKCSCLAATLQLFVVFPYLFNLILQVDNLGFRGNARRYSINRSDHKALSPVGKIKEASSTRCHRREIRPTTINTTFKMPGAETSRLLQTSDVLVICPLLLFVADMAADIAGTTV